MERNAEISSLNIGEKAPYFSLYGTDGKIHSLSDFANCKVLVVIFTCNHCPYARAYESRLCELGRRFGAEGVGFVAICSNNAQDFPEDSFDLMVQKSKALDLPFPYLHDSDQNVASAYDASCTPECYVFDENRRLAYHGWVDDNHEDPQGVQSPDLRLAIEALLVGKTPPKSTTTVLGCSIKWKKT